jgi:hypothetical protein
VNQPSPPADAPVAPSPVPGPESVAPSGGSDFAEMVAVLVLVTIAVGLLEFFYSQFPVPPGVDPGDWIQRSYAWVGLVHPPAYSVGSPYLYPPAIFPLLGLLRVATGSPESTGFIFAGFVLAAYGLTLWFLARVALRLSIHRVALVALGLLNGTVLSMLFWGAYPNFFAFSFVNLALAFLILTLRQPTVLRGVLLGGSAALTYLTHTLTFALLMGVIVLTFLLAVVLGRLPWRRLFHWGNLLGAAILGATVGSYTVITDLLHIPHINYLYANPPSFTLVGLGTVFSPLAKAPTFAPMGSTIELTPHGAAEVLAVGGLAALLITAFVVRRFPGRWESATLVGGTWLGVMLLAPVGGYLAHIDTDYSRFVYFFPLPLTFVAFAIYEGALPPSLRSTPSAGPSVVSPAPSRYRLLRPRPYAVLSAGAVVVAVAFLLVNVTLPTMASAETGDTESGHDAAFLAATSYLAHNPAPGSVLTTQSAARWTEALTSRGAFDPGPTWLQFETIEISNAQESYFATNTETAVTNNLLVASYSGYATTSLNQAPLLSAIVLGAPIPLLRVLPASEATDSTGPGCSGWTAAAASGTPALSVPGPSAISGQIREANGCATTVQTVTLAPDSPTGWLNYTITPAPGDALLGFNVTLTSPPPRNEALHAGPLTNLTASGPSLAWSSETALGQFPGGANISLTGAIAPSPTSVVANSSNGTGQVAYGFSNPDPTGPLAISIEMTVPMASNPAVVLPTVLSTAQFFATNSIEFLLLPSTVPYAETLDFLSATFGFVVVFTNSEWTVLQAP